MFFPTGGFILRTPEEAQKSSAKTDRCSSGCYNGVRRLFVTT